MRTWQIHELKNTDICFFAAKRSPTSFAEQHPDEWTLKTNPESASLSFASHSNPTFQNCRDRGHAMGQPTSDPPVADQAPTADVLTAYDQNHAVIYLRLLDADAEGADSGRSGPHRPSHRSSARTRACPSRLGEPLGARQMDDEPRVPASAPRRAPKLSRGGRPTDTDVRTRVSTTFGPAPQHSASGAC